MHSISSRKHKKHPLTGRQQKSVRRLQIHKLDNIVADKITLDQSFHFFSSNSTHFLFLPRHLNFASRKYMCVCWMNGEKMISLNGAKIPSKKVQRKCERKVQQRCKNYSPSKKQWTNTNTNTIASQLELCHLCKLRLNLLLSGTVLKCLFVFRCVGLYGCLPQLKKLKSLMNSVAAFKKSCSIQKLKVW